jgi:DNA repair protein RadC
MSSIRSWPPEHRPREKLLNHGPETLSDAELLAVVFRTGCSGLSALDLAKQLIEEFGSLGDLISCPTKPLLSRRGVGRTKAAGLQACLELGKRVMREPLPNRDLLKDFASTQQYLISRLRNCREEQFMALFLNQANQLLHDEILFRGTVNEAAVHPREVVKRALELNATNVIVAHNHPSGTARASLADIEITHRLIGALRCVDIRLLDHVIVAGPECVSLRACTGLFS